MFCFVLFLSLICTHIDIRAQRRLPLLLLYCVPGRLASGLSSGPEASGSRQGGGGWLHLPGDLLQGPHCGLAHFSCLSSKARLVEGEGARREYGGAATVIFLCALSQYASLGWCSVSTLRCLSLPIRNAACAQYNQSICFHSILFFVKLLRPLLY